MSMSTPPLLAQLSSSSSSFSSFSSSSPAPHAVGIEKKKKEEEEDEKEKESKKRWKERVKKWTLEKNSNKGHSIFDIASGGSSGSGGGSEGGNLAVKNDGDDDNNEDGQLLDSISSVFDGWDASSLLYTPLTAVTSKVPCFLLENVLSRSECDALVQSVPFRDGEKGYMNREEVERRYRGRECHRYLSLDFELSSLIESRISRYIPQSLDGGGYFGLSPEWRFVKYESGGYFRPHIDGREERMVEGLEKHGSFVESRLTIQLYLNTCGEDFRGGEFKFLVDPDKGKDFVIRPKAGDCIVFYQEVGKDNIECLHEGIKVTSGVKYAARTMVEYIWPCATSEP